jgi:hypothetical protein
MNSIEIHRVWAMPSANTFTIKPIAEQLKKYISTKELWIDAFANSNKIATITNDLNPEYNTDYHLDALNFFKMFNDNSVDGVLYDPPYSLRQVSECYKNVGIPVTTETTQSSWRSKHIDEIARIVKPGGKAISFGWNSGGIGKMRSFKIIEILLVAHGGSHNDTIVTVEQKI